ncbi:hypothetical protein HETIRDRAFT_102234, partial [Heterobasidion irregulare TC 32-1]
MPLQSGGSRIGDLVRIRKAPDTGAWQGRRDLHPGSVVASGNVRETAAVHGPRDKQRSAPTRPPTSLPTISVSAHHLLGRPAGEAHRKPRLVPITRAAQRLAAMRASTGSRSSSPLARTDLAGSKPPREIPKPKARHSKCTERPAPAPALAPKPSPTRKPPPIVSRPPAPSHSATPSPLRPSTPLNNEATPQRYITPFAKSHRRAFSLLTPSPSIASLASASTGPAPAAPR